MGHSSGVSSQTSMWEVGHKLLLPWLLNQDPSTCPPNCGSDCSQKEPEAVLTLVTTALLLSSPSFPHSCLQPLKRFVDFLAGEGVQWGTACSWVIDCIVPETLWLLFKKPKLWTSKLVQTLEPSLLWIQNKINPQSKAWLIQIQNAVISDSFTRSEFKNLLSLSIEVFELCLCRQQCLPSWNSGCHYQLVKNFRMILGDRKKSEVKILSQYTFIDMPRHCHTLKLLLIV